MKMTYKEYKTKWKGYVLSCLLKNEKIIEPENLKELQKQEAKEIFIKNLGKWKNKATIEEIDYNNSCYNNPENFDQYNPFLNI